MEKNKKLLSLIILISLFFSFWSCANQDEEVFEEIKTESIRLKNLPNDHDGGKEDTFHYNTSCADTFNLTIHYTSKTSSQMITQIRNNNYIDSNRLLSTQYFPNHNGIPGHTIDVWSFCIGGGVLVSNGTESIYIIAKPNSKGMIIATLEEDENIASVTP